MLGPSIQGDDLDARTFLHKIFIYVVHMPLFIMTAGTFAPRRVDSLSSLYEIS